MKPTRERIVYGTGRQTLLAAAVQVANEKGLSGLTYREVAREAGVAHSLVSHHFGTRHNLVRATMDYAVQVGSQTIHFEDDNLEEFADDLDSLIRDTPGLQAFQIELAINARSDPALSTVAMSMYDQYIEMMRDDLERIGLSDDPVFSRLVMAALDGLVIQQLVYNSPEQTRESIEMLRRLIARLGKSHIEPSQTDSSHTLKGVDTHDRNNYRYRISPRNWSGHRREALG